MKHVLLWSLLLLTSNTLLAQGWGQTQKIVTTERSIADFFGWSVAMDGDYAVIGARGGGPPNVYKGTVYVFKKDGNGVWIEIDQLTNIDNANFDEYGYSVAISGDYIFVGAIGQDYIGNGTGNYMSGAGAVYVYKNDGFDNWNEAQKIVAPDREIENGFGSSLAIYGNYAAVGVVKHDYDGSGFNFLDDAGAVYIFEIDDSGIWNEVQKIVASDRETYDYFGRYALSIYGDVLVVGAYFEDDDNTGSNNLSGSGSAYIFERDGNGVWNEVQKIVASDREEGEWFGKSVGISGNTIVVGAEQEYLIGNANVQYGAAYIFEKEGSGVWNEVQKIRPSYLEHTSKFGQSVSIDGNHIVVGAFKADIGNVTDGGAAFMFEKNGLGVWNEVAVMYDANANTSDSFGYDVALSGNYAMVGAYQEDEDETGINTLSEAGSSYIFDINEPNTLAPLATLSIVENKFENTIRAFPNPTKNELSIDLNQYFESIEISIYNLLGQLVYYNTYYNKRTINFQLNISNGSYLAHIKTGEAKHSVLKIIKY